MNARTIAWLILDVFALLVSAVLVALAIAPPSLFVSVLSVVVAVRAGSRGNDPPNDPPGTAPRLGGGPGARAEPSAVGNVARGLARWAVDLAGVARGPAQPGRARVAALGGA